MPNGTGGFDPQRKTANRPQAGAFDPSQMGRGGMSGIPLEARPQGPGFYNQMLSGSAPAAFTPRNRMGRGRGMGALYNVLTGILPGLGQGQGFGQMMAGGKGITDKFAGLQRAQDITGTGNKQMIANVTPRPGPDVMGNGNEPAFDGPVANAINGLMGRIGDRVDTFGNNMRDRLGDGLFNGRIRGALDNFRQRLGALRQ